MATDAPPMVRDAVRSLLAQDVAVEIVVVNTGDGSARSHLVAEEDFVISVETAQRQYAGGTRNLGIQYCSAPIIAFLAADCLAADGWARRRLELHRDGNKTVASALLPAPEESNDVSMFAWASYATLHSQRMPEVPEAKAKRYGLSYHRDLFEEFGLFRDDLRIGEDTEFNSRLRRGRPAVWDPAIVTLHRYPSTLRAALSDQFRRGRRAAAAKARKRSATPVRYLFAQPKSRITQPRHYVRSYSTGVTRDAILRARHLLPVLALAYGLGALSLYFTGSREKDAE